MKSSACRASLARLTDPVVLCVQRENRAIGRNDAAPGLSVLVLLVADGHAEFPMREGAADEVDEGVASVAPVGVQQIPLLEQVAREIQRRPGGPVGGSLVILEKLRKERAIRCGARDLIPLDPLPKRLSLGGELLIAVREQPVVEPQDVRHVPGNISPAFTASVIGSKRPGRMRRIATALVRGKDAGVVQSLLQVPALTGRLVQADQGITGNPALVRLDLIGAVTLRTGIRGQREPLARAGRAREGRVAAGIGGE